MAVGSEAAAIQSRQVGLSYDSGIEALRDISVDIDAGAFVAIVGPSGCGKSSFLRLVSGLQHTTAGELLVDGQAPILARQQRRHLSYVLQDATLLAWRRVRDNVGLPLEVRHTPTSTAEDRVDAALDLVGLQDVAHMFPHQLSGGMRMRVSIARAMVTDPGLLLLDEPFGALDEITRQRLNDELLALWQESRWTCLFVTHSVQEAVFLSQRVVVMSPRPGQITARHDIDLPYPRDRAIRTSAAFGQIVARVAADLEG